MITTKLKNIVFSKKIRKAINNKASLDRGISGKVGLIIDAENFENFKELSVIYRKLGLKKEDFSLVVCGSAHLLPENMDADFLDPKEITVSGEFKSERIRDFARDRYDFLICHLSEKNQAGYLLAAVTNAGIKLGNHPDEFGIYDVEIFSDSLEEFQHEVIKYFRIFKNK